MPERPTMKRYAIILAASMLLPNLAIAQDKWSGADKKMHFGVSAVLGFAAVNQWPDDKPKAFMVAMIPGLLKEVSDAQKGGTGFSGKDLVANALGAAVGVYAGGWMISRRDGATVVAYQTLF